MIELNWAVNYIENTANYNKLMYNNNRYGF